MSISAEIDLRPWLAVFERFPFPAIVVERGTTRLIRANRAAVNLLDLDAAAVGADDGPHLVDLVTKSRDRLDEDLRIAAGGGDVPLVLRSPPPDKPARHRVQVVPISFGDQPVDRWLVSFSCNLGRLDRFEGMTGKLRRANEEAARQRQLNKRATDELRTLERFAQAMAHDLKGPLRHIGTLLPAIEDSLGADLPPESRRLMELARQSAGRGRELVDALLTHATAVSGELRPGQVDLDHLVEATVADQRWHLEQIQHTISLVGELGMIHADRALVGLLLDNLIGNAIKYRNPDRTLQIEISSGAADSGTIIEVADNGLGFDPADATRVFEPFVRLESSIEGHGIGLATCQTICHRHGWRIEADARRDQGARFRVRSG